MTSTNPLPGHPFFAYVDSVLCAEGLPLDRLVAEHGAPLFVYSKAAMLAALGAYQQGLEGRRSQICYAMKANSSLALLQVFARAGCGFDIVSAGELERVLHVGVAPEKIVFSGVGKTAEEMRRALEVGIGCFNIESEAELDLLNAQALQVGRKAPISIRVNPNVDPKTHPYISTGLKGNKFGIAHERVVQSYQRAASLPGLEVVGIDCHIGSQITEMTPYLDAVDRMLDLVAAVEATGVRLHHLDFGGGLGITYHNDTPPHAGDLWKAMLAKLDARGYGDRLIMLEPGRSLVGNAGVCVTQVQIVKPGDQKNFCIVDAAMNDLPRPAMYQAYHHIAPVRPRGGAGTVYDVVGPICESGDWIARERSLDVQRGDLLAVMSAGAYCMSMASNYNSRGRAAEVLVDGSQAHLIRRRETVQELFSHETLIG